MDPLDLDGVYKEVTERSGFPVLKQVCGADDRCDGAQSQIFLSVVTDLTEVLRLGTAKAQENLAFRRYLSARHSADAPFQILASEVQQHMDYTNYANCCRPCGQRTRSD